MNIRNTAEAAVEMFPILHDLSLKNNLLTRNSAQLKRGKIYILSLLAKSLITIVRQSDDWVVTPASLSFGIDVLAFGELKTSAK